MGAIFLWQFYTPISSYFNINFEDVLADGSVSIAIIAIIANIANIAAAMAVFLMVIPKTLAKRNFVVVIPTMDKNYTSDDRIVLPYTLENKRSDVITEIGVSIFAPGLFVLSKGKNMLYKSMGGKTTKNEKLESFLYVPKETVPGEYTVELNWSFYVGSEKYTKTNEIKVNIVS